MPEGSKLSKARKGGRVGNACCCGGRARKKDRNWLRRREQRLEAGREGVLQKPRAAPAGVAPRIEHRPAD